MVTIPPVVGLTDKGLPLAPCHTAKLYGVQFEAGVVLVVVRVLVGGVGVGVVAPPNAFHEFASEGGEAGKHAGGKEHDGRGVSDARPVEIQLPAGLGNPNEVEQTVDQQGRNTDENAGLAKFVEPHLVILTLE